MKRTALFGAVRGGLWSGPRARRHELHEVRGQHARRRARLGSRRRRRRVRVGGSYELNDQIHVFGSWQDQSLDFGIDGRSLELGAGYPHGFSDKLDFVGTLSYVDAEVKLGNQTADDDGLALGGGIRSRVGESVELDAA